jgi:hypothetical protein
MDGKSIQGYKVEMHCVKPSRQTAEKCRDHKRDKFEPIGVITNTSCPVFIVLQTFKHPSEWGIYDTDSQKYREKKHKEDEKVKSDLVIEVKGPEGRPRDTV